MDIARFPLLFCVAALAALLFSNTVTGQCALQWQPGDAIPFAHGDALATVVWDADGAGPAPAVLVVGGRFGVGTMLNTGLATFDGANWGALGTPPLPRVTALTTWNGQLVAAGGSGNQHGIAIYNGTTWSVLGSTNGPINTMTVFGGNLFVGGFFTLVNGALIRNIAQWNGTAWSEPGFGVAGEVTSMVVFGSLYVGGFLTQAGTTAVSSLAIWNGTSWAAAAAFNGPVFSLAARNGATPASSFLFAGGDFSNVGGVPAQDIARFSSSTAAWTAIPGLPGSVCRVVHVRSTGLTTFQLHAAVEDHNAATKVWRLNGSTWLSLGSVFDDTEPLPTSLVFFNSQLVAAFESNQIDPRLSQAVRIHDGTLWQPARGPGFDGGVQAVTVLSSDFVVGGTFRRHGSTLLNCVARGAPGAWQALGSGFEGGAGVLALCTLQNGDVVAGGDFTHTGGSTAQNIACWDGSAWHELGSGVDGAVHALLPLPNGDFIAAGQFTHASGVLVDRIARWNGSTWSPLGIGIDGTVTAVARLSNGNLVAAGGFFHAGGVPANCIAMWGGSTWSALGTGVDDYALALAILPGDHIVVGGDLMSAGGVPSPAVARWDGSAWLAQSTSTTAWDNGIKALVALPNGEYLGGGLTSFFGLGGIFGGSDANLARHTGGAFSFQWDALDLLGSEVNAMVMRPNGDLVLAGSFDGAGGLASQNLAVLRPTCPATAVSYGIGCVGSGGPNVLSTTSPAWIGSTFRGRATGMPSAAIALVVTGFSPLAVPMPLVLPQGVAGCTLLVSPDLIDAALPNAGVVTTQVMLPNTVALAGQLFHQQVVPFEISLAGDVVAVTGSNGLRLTIGAL